MKIKLRRNCILFFSLLFFVTTSQSQSLSVSAYGVWDRGDGVTDFSDPNYDFVLGIESGAYWSDVNPSRNSFNFSALQFDLDKALANHKLIRFSIGVGPDGPAWMYDNDSDPTNNPYPQMRKVTTSGGNDKDKFPYYPQYLSQTHKDYLFKLIQEFSNFLRNQPKEKFDLIAFVQIKTGCTGDEVAYKGTVDNPADAISKDDWEKYRYEVFNEYKKWFNDVPDRRIVLTFNSLDPFESGKVEAWNWVTTHIDPQIGFGIKGGAYNRGHHLSDEQPYKETWTPYLINPKGTKLFSASEMDQSWTKGYFAINYEIGFYWGALAGINVGLSTYNVSKSAMDYASTHPEIRDIFRMFSKYAQQVYPATASTAFSIFHEGLNSADKIKFPENIYGKSTMANIDRYKKICKTYESRGARIDDSIAVVQGQVYQRDKQTGYNDAGWEIAEGNIERFFTQIKPDSTSIGLFRVRGTIDQNSSKYDRFARSFENAKGKNTMFFKFDQEVFANSTPKSLKFKIIWLDKIAGSTWSFNYKSTQGIKSAIQVTGIGDNTWKEVYFTITDAIIDCSGLLGSDFRLVNTDTKDDIFNGIEVEIERMSTVINTIIDIKGNSFQLFPNPVKSVLYWKNNVKIGIAKIYSMNGTLQIQTNNPDRESIDVSQLHRGIYFIQLCNGNQVIHTVKFIKE